MTKYVKLPVEIDMVKVPLNEYADSPYGDWDEIPDWLRTAFNSEVIVPVFKGEDYWYYEIKTLEGVMTAGPDDMIAQGVDGEIYPIKQAIFDKTYRPFSEEETLDKINQAITTKYDEETLTKVYTAMQKQGLDSKQGIELVHAMQSEGILFRERAE